jgi:hypothetical protein
MRPPVLRFRRSIVALSVGLGSLAACIDVSGLRGGSGPIGDAGPGSDAPLVPPEEASVPFIGCDGGACPPIAITTGESNITVDVALSSDDVFFTVIADAAAAGKVVRCKKSGCRDDRREIATGLRFPFFLPRLFVEGGLLYFAVEETGGVQIKRCPIAGCPGAPEVVNAPANISSRGFFVEGSFAYYGVGRELHRHPLPGVAGTDTVLTTAATAIGGIVVVSGDVYFTEPDYEDFGTNGAVSKISTDGGTAAPLRPMKYASRAVKTSRGVLVGPYPDKVDSLAGNLVLYPRGDEVYSSNDAFVDIAADGNNIYFTTKLGDLRTNGFTSPSAAVRTLTGYEPKGVAVDDTAIYVAYPFGVPDAGSPSVYKFLK